MKYIAALLCMLCMILPISAISDDIEFIDETDELNEQGEILSEDTDAVDDILIDSDDVYNADSLTASPAEPTAIDRMFADHLATRAAPAIFGVASAFDTAFYHGNSGALATVGRQESMKLSQAVGVIRSMEISEQYEPIRTELLAKVSSLQSDIDSASKLKQGCSKCVAEINKLKETAENFGVWTIRAISEIS